MKYADKIGAKLSCVLGDDEIQSCSAKVKDMEDGSVQQVEFKDLPNVVYEKQLKDLSDQIGDEDISF